MFEQRDNELKVAAAEKEKRQAEKEKRQAEKEKRQEIKTQRADKMAKNKNISLQMKSKRANINMVLTLINEGLETRENGKRDITALRAEISALQSQMEN